MRGREFKNILSESKIANATESRSVRGRQESEQEPRLTNNGNSNGSAAADHHSACKLIWSPIGAFSDDRNACRASSDILAYTCL